MFERTLKLTDKFSREQPLYADNGVTDFQKFTEGTQNWIIKIEQHLVRLMKSEDGETTRN